MGYNQVKVIVGWIIIIGHVGLAVLAGILLTPVLEKGQIFDVLLVLSPITLAYFTSVISNVIRTPYQRSKGRLVSRNFLAVAVFVPSALVVFVGVLIATYPNIAGDVSGLQRGIAAVEALLGTAVGMLVSELFPAREDTA